MENSKIDLLDESVREIIFGYLKELQEIFFRVDLAVRKEAGFLLEEGSEKHTFSLGNEISMSQEKFAKVLADFYLIEPIIPNRAHSYQIGGLPEMKRYVRRIEKFLNKYVPSIQMPPRPKELIGWLEGDDN